LFSPPIKHRNDPDETKLDPFEFLTLTGWTPHDSQQKPLRPGSAAVRLADALQTREQSAGEQTGARVNR